MTRVRVLVLLIALAIVATACGQKSGVGGQNVAAGAGGGGGAAAGDDLGVGAGDAGTSTEDTTGTATAAGGDAGTGAATGGDTGAGGAAGGTTTGAATTGGGAGGAASGTTTGDGTAAGDRTGITDTVIKIGIHAPVTGAAPFPANSFNTGKDIYWKFLGAKGVLGRQVQVVFRDDQFNPSRAVQVCREMVEKEKVFLLVGGGGADQITACAKYANQAGVPYMSAGVNEEGLSNLRSYFAASMTYPQQSPLLVQYVKNVLKKAKVGVVVADTPSFADAKSSFIRVAKEQGLQIVHQDPYPKNASQGDALRTANALRAAGTEVVYVLTSPTSFIYLAQAANGQAYNPPYIGPGISSGLNQVTQFGCPGAGTARFLSPFPQLDVVDSLDPNYRRAYRQHGGGEGDDIGLALWAINKTLHQVFEAAGKDVSRQSFVATLESGKEFASNLFPPLKFAAGKHFGANQAHMLRADCGARTYKTEKQFASGF